MAPKNKFTKEEMVAAALRVVRAKGADGLTAKTIADELGTSTQPIFTAFGSMGGIRQAVYAAAVRVYDDYTKIGLQEKIPFLGVGTQYIRFAREEPELYRLLFLTQTQEFSAMQAMRHLQALVRPTLIAMYHCGRGRFLFPQSLAGGAQSVDADRDRRLPVSGSGNWPDPDRLQLKHLQGHQGNSGLCGGNV